MFIDASSIESWDYTQELTGITGASNIATAVIWLKKNAMEMQEQISDHLKTLPGICKTTIIKAQPSILRVQFDFDQIRYAEIISKINSLGYEARVVGH